MNITVFLNAIVQSYEVSMERQSLRDFETPVTIKSLFWRRPMVQASFLRGVFLAACVSALPATAQTVNAEETAPPTSESSSDVDTIAVDEGAATTEELESESDDIEGGFEDDEGTTLVIGKRGARKRIAGSATVIDEEDLQKMEYDDVQRALKQKVPGVYVREEDGFGLRPNIGLRGANSDRSAKITLLEDNILFAPAPYAAPPAYYFPLTTRMVGVEVFKGPAALRTGPNTVGGAVNVRTRRVPWSGVVGGIDVAGGMYESGKGHAYLGAGTPHFGILVEGVHLRSGGFKRLDGSPGNGLWGNDTGFSRNDVMLKARANTDPTRDWMHLLEVKLGFGNEDSKETYLGLTDADFEKDPFRRYLASTRGHMQWNRTQVQARYRFTWGENIDANVTVYRHDLQRAWEKFNRFNNGPEVRKVMQDPTSAQNTPFYRLMTGTRESTNNDDALMIGVNDRRFFSQGIQAQGRIGFDLGPVRQDVEMGLRLHQDQIVRHHSEDAYLVQGGALVDNGDPTLLTADNTGAAVAASGFVVDEIGFGPLLLTPGLRVEVIRTTFQDRLPEEDELIDVTRVAFIPGIGGYVQALPMLGFFGGVHRGFAPVSPGQREEVQPEDSWNYELGTRLDWHQTRGELVGYVNHYTNLTGACTFSAGCSDSELNTQFNAGEAIVGGAEVVLGQRVDLPFDTQFSIDGVYTLTIARFLSDFTSGFPQWGDVEAGDELPYVPTHQASVTAGFERGPLIWTTSASYVGTMLDQAGQGELDPILTIPAALYIDTMASYALFEGGSLYVRVDNILNTKTIAARRPFGSRPGKPLLAMIGYRHAF